MRLALYQPDIAAKTGTADKVSGRGYSHHSVVTTVAGVFPIDEPRYVVVAMLDDPKPTKETYGFRTSGWNVAPVVSRVVGRIGPVLGVAPDLGRDANLNEVLPFIHDMEKH